MQDDSRVGVEKMQAGEPRLAGGQRGSAARMTRRPGRTFQAQRGHRVSHPDCELVTATLDRGSQTVP